MKHIFKYSALLGALLGLLVMTTCQNIFENGGISKPQNGVRITISGLSNDARTVLPNTTFESYRLLFTPNAGQAPFDPVDIGVSGTVTVFGLAQGSWTIKAEGYVRITDGRLLKGAEGSTTVNIGGGDSNNTINISISASNSDGGPDGIFRYTASFPNTVNLDGIPITVTDAIMYVYAVGAAYDNPSGKNYAVFAAQNRSGSVEVAPGYHMISVVLKTTQQPKPNAPSGPIIGEVVKTEVVHIYSNMESSHTFSFVESDFSNSPTPFITLSGTMNVTAGGGAPARTTVYALRKPVSPESDEFSYNRLDEAVVETSYGPWKLMFATQDNLDIVYLMVYAEVSNQVYYQIARTVDMRTDPRDNIALNLNLASPGFNDSITLSGTLDVRVTTFVRAPNGNSTSLAVPASAGVSVTGVTVFASLDPVDYKSQDNLLGQVETEISGPWAAATGPWSIQIGKLNASTPVYFVAEIQYDPTSVPGDTGECVRFIDWRNVYNTSITGVKGPANGPGSAANGTLSVIYAGPQIIIGGRLRISGLNVAGVNNSAVPNIGYQPGYVEVKAYAIPSGSTDADLAGFADNLADNVDAFEPIGYNSVLWTGNAGERTWNMAIPNECYGQELALEINVVRVNDGYNPNGGIEARMIIDPVWNTRVNPTSPANLPTWDNTMPGRNRMILRHEIDTVFNNTIAYPGGIKGLQTASGGTTTINSSATVAGSIASGSQATGTPAIPEGRNIDMTTTDEHSVVLAGMLTVKDGGGTNISVSDIRSAYITVYAGLGTNGNDGIDLDTPLVKRRILGSSFAPAAVTAASWIALIPAVLPAATTTRRVWFWLDIETDYGSFYGQPVTSALVPISRVVDNRANNAGYRIYYSNASGIGRGTTDNNFDFNVTFE